MEHVQTDTSLSAATGSPTSGESPPESHRPKSNPPKKTKTMMIEILTLLFIFYIFWLPSPDGQMSHIHIHFRFKFFQREIDHLVLQPEQLFKFVSPRTVSRTDHLYRMA